MTKIKFAATAYFGSSASEKAELEVPLYHVEEIEILELDEGSANDKSGGVLEGMINGKEYKLQVKSFKDEKSPKNLNSINWSFSYLANDGSIVIGAFQDQGKEVSFKADNLDFCGKKITFYAYINNKDQEGSLEVFHHYRFRWFDRHVIEEQISIRTQYPWKIDQGQTSLCGMACLFYIIAKNDPIGYEKLSKELHSKGTTKYNQYIIEAGYPEMYEVNPKTSKEHPRIPEIDWISLASTRSKESSIGYKGKKGQDASAINWPGIMKDLGKKMLGYKKVEMDYFKLNKSYIRDFFDYDEKIRILEKDINVDYKSGYQICMLIDADMVSRKVTEYDISDLGEYHWVVYEGGLEILNKAGKPESDYDYVTNINFNVFTWAQLRNGSFDPTIKPIKNLMRKIKLTKNQFRANYYGYLRLK